MNIGFSFSRAAVQGYIFYLLNDILLMRKNMQIRSCKRMGSPGDETGTPQLQSTNQQA